MLALKIDTVKQLPEKGGNSLAFFDRIYRMDWIHLILLIKTHILF